MGDAYDAASTCVHGTVKDPVTSPWCKTLMNRCHFPCPLYCRPATLKKRLEDEK